jgi:hypothetical protein
VPFVVYVNAAVIRVLKLFSFFFQVSHSYIARVGMCTSVECTLFQNILLIKNSTQQNSGYEPAVQVAPGVREASYEGTWDVLHTLSNTGQKELTQALTTSSSITLLRAWNKYSLFKLNNLCTLTCLQRMITQNLRLELNHHWKGICEFSLWDHEITLRSMGAFNEKGSEPLL